MKKYFAIILCLLITVNLLSQEKYSVPVITSDQKSESWAYQYWTMISAGVKFAKTQGVTPYAYGKYMGSLFAPSWGAGNNFEAYVRGMVFNFEAMHLTSDPKIIVKEDNDGSVEILTNDKIFHRYFPVGKGYATYNEFIEFFKGVSEPIADHMGAKTLIEIKDTIIVISIKKK
jgi:hypothetical protein